MCVFSPELFYNIPIHFQNSLNDLKIPLRTTIFLITYKYRAIGYVNIEI